MFVYIVLWVAAEAKKGNPYTKGCNTCRVVYEKVVRRTGYIMYSEAL